MAVARSQHTARGLLAIDGPYEVGGAHAAPSNVALREQLRARVSSVVRELEAVVDAVAANDFVLIERAAILIESQSLAFESRAPAERERIPQVLHPVPVANRA